MEQTSNQTQGERSSRQAFLDRLFTEYRPVEILSENENKSVAAAQHKSLKETVIIRSDSSKQPLYGLLCAVRHPNLPEVFDVYDFDDGEIVISEHIRGIALSEAMGTGHYTYAAQKRSCRSCATPSPFCTGSAGYTATSSPTTW